MIVSVRRDLSKEPPRFWQALAFSSFDAENITLAILAIREDYSENAAGVVAEQSNE